MSDDGDHGSPRASTPPPPPPPVERQRPKLDLTGGPRKRPGKSMFGLVLGTLNKAKLEDKERNASEAAKKRQLIEQRLQTKLRKETEVVRKAEEAKKEKNLANRKEEELQLSISIFKLRKKRLPLLSRFLLTSDVIPSEEPGGAEAPRKHPPPLYYLPAILLPAQQAFIDARTASVSQATTTEWDQFLEQKAKDVEEIKDMREKAEQARLEKEKNGSAGETMDVDEGAQKDETAVEEESKTAPPPQVERKAVDDDDTNMQDAPADGDDAVEY